MRVVLVLLVFVMMLMMFLGSFVLCMILVSLRVVSGVVFVGLSMMVLL